jgi:hypothetical protein
MFAVFSNTLSILNLVQLKILWLPKKVRVTYNLGWTEYIERIRLLGFDSSSRKLCFPDAGVIYTKQLAPGRPNGYLRLDAAQVPTPVTIRPLAALKRSHPHRARITWGIPLPQCPRPPSSPLTHMPGSCRSRPSPCPWASPRHLPRLSRHRGSPVSTY